MYHIRFAISIRAVWADGNKTELKTKNLQFLRLLRTIYLLQSICSVQSVSVLAGLCCIHYVSINATNPTFINTQHFWGHNDSDRFALEIRTVRRSN